MDNVFVWTLKDVATVAYLVIAGTGLLAAYAWLKWGGRKP